MVKTRRFRLIPEYGDLKDPSIRAKYGYLEAVVSIVGNVGLFLLKLFLGLFISSVALIADGVHSLSDVVTSGVVIVGFRSAKKPPDAEHPYGHGRVEYITTLVIAIILVIVALTLIQQSIEKLINPVPLIHQEYALIIAGVVLFSAFVKELMARYSKALSKKIQSDALDADAWHHRSDALSSIPVAISIIGSRYGYPILDPIFGILVSVIIIYVGVKLVKSSTDFLIGKGPDEDVIKTIKKISNSINGIKGIHKLSVHDYGTTKVITLHVEVDSFLKIEDAHKIADELEDRIHSKTNYSTVIHLEPTSSKDDFISEKRKMIQTILENQKEIKSFHKIKIIENVEKDDIKIHCVVDKDMSVEDSHIFCHDLESVLQKEYGPCSLNVHFEPCINNCKICTISCKEREK